MHRLRLVHIRASTKSIGNGTTNATQRAAHANSPGLNKRLRSRKMKCAPPHQDNRHGQTPRTTYCQQSPATCLVRVAPFVVRAELTESLVDDGAAIEAKPAAAPLKMLRNKNPLLRRSVELASPLPLRTQSAIRPKIVLRMRGRADGYAPNSSTKSFAPSAAMVGGGKATLQAM